MNLPLSFMKGRLLKKRDDMDVALEVSGLMAMSRRRLQLAKELHENASKLAPEAGEKLEQLKVEALELAKEATAFAAEAKLLMVGR